MTSVSSPGTITVIDNITLSTESVEIYNQIISDELLRNLNFYINALLCGKVALLGTVSNVINMIIFKRLTLQTSMNVSLFALSLTDFLMSFLTLVTRVIPIWDLFFAREAIDPKTVDKIAFAWLDDPLFIISGWITALLSMERCLCVTFPFKVKSIFTRNRSIIMILIIVVVVFGTFMPIFATQWLEWSTVEVGGPGNETRLEKRLIARFSENRHLAEYYVEILVVSVLPIPSLFIIVIAVIWMSVGLHTSAQIRDSMTTNNSKGESQITSKTRRLVKVVLSLAIIFIVCSIPRAYASYFGMYNTDIHIFGKEQNLSDFNWNLARFALAVNASINIFVYTKINASYRAELGKLCSCFSKRE